ncbi:MAG: hypothetical protein LBQ57_07400 [Spirochaetales bacterium]|jgi:TolB-like protein|nr:hypothetical protein [Spirochaetales bacterium]
MKRILKKAGLCAILLYALTGCASFNSGSVTTLDNAVQLASKELETTLPGGVKIAVLSFKSDSEALSEYVIEELMGTLVKGKKLVVVDRNSLDLVRQEWNFQLSGEVSDDSAQSIGKMLGAQAVVSGNLMDLGNAYRFRVYTLNVETAAREAAAMYTVSKDEQITYLLGGQVTAAKPAAVAQKSPFEGVWRGKTGKDTSYSGEIDELWSNFTVTITGNEGILKYYGRDGGNDATGNFAKGLVKVEGNFITGTLTHIWGNLFGENLGGYWLTTQDFLGDEADDPYVKKILLVWRAELVGNTLMMRPNRDQAGELGIDGSWGFIKQ